MKTKKISHFRKRITFGGPRIATEIQENKVKINNKEAHFYGEKGSLKRYRKCLYSSICVLVQTYLYLQVLLFYSV